MKQLTRCQLKVPAAANKWIESVSREPSTRVKYYGKEVVSQLYLYFYRNVIIIKQIYVRNSSIDPILNTMLC